MSEKTVREVQTPYVIEAKEAIGRDTIIVQENGEPVAAVVPYKAYRILLDLSKDNSPKIQKGSWEFEQQWAASERLMPELVKTHPGQWVGIVNEQAVAFGTDSRSVIRAIREQYGDVSFCVREIRVRPRVVRIGSPKIIARL